VYPEVRSQAYQIKQAAKELEAGSFSAPVIGPTSPMRVPHRLRIMVYNMVAPCFAARNGIGVAQTPTMMIGDELSRGDRSVAALGRLRWLVSGRRWSLAGRCGQLTRRMRSKELPDPCEN